MSRTRIRRGKEVIIPEEWQGKTTHDQTIRKRPSKNLHKWRKWMKHGGDRKPRPAERNIDSTDFDMHNEVDDLLGYTENQRRQDGPQPEWIEQDENLEDD